MEIPGFVTVKDAAERIGLSDKRVYQLIEEGQLEIVELGRRAYLVKVKSIDKFLRGRENGKRRK